MGSITIAGTGMWEKHLSQEIIDLLNGQRTIVLQTERCYLAQWLQVRQIAYGTLDSLYEYATDFEEWTHLAVDELVERAEETDLIYAVPGAGKGLPLIERLYARGKKKAIPVRMATGISLGDAMQAEAMEMGWIDDAPNLFAFDALEKIKNAKDSLCIQELDSMYLASTLKLRLMEYFPEEWPVRLGKAGETGFEWRNIPLFELDRLEETWYSHRTGLCIEGVPFARRPAYDEEDLRVILTRLRALDGCPWDRVQTHQSLKNNTLEEVYELIDAIEQNQDDEMVEELGDVLMLMHFHAIIGEEQARFSLSEIYTRICEKLIYRHPHVFIENAKQINTIEDNGRQWEELKRAEKGQERFADTLYAVPKAFPALMRAQKVIKRAATAGLKEESAYAIWKDLHKQIEAMERMIEEDKKTDIQLAIGLILLNIVGLAQCCGIDAEEFLRKMTDRFCRDFAEMEQVILADGKQMNELKIEQIWGYWDRIKNKLLTKRK